MDLQTLDTTECLRLLESGEVSSVELLTLFAERMKAHNPAINAVIETDLESAMARAKSADDARANGESWGALHGLPMTIKDTFEVVGMRTTAGANSLKEHRPKTNAAAVQKLLDAGAIVWGKTNTPPFAMDIQTYNDLHGVTNNPWDITRTPGGSSGGSAAALAAGFTTLELGSDIGGSIRTPASFCGVYGHKPTHGIVSLQGQIPGPPGTKSHPDLAVAGPLGRSADDLALALNILAGPEPLKSPGWKLELPKARHKKLADFRVAVWLDDKECAVDSEIVEMLNMTALAIRQAGAKVTEAKPAGHKEILSIYYTLLSAIVGSSLPNPIFQMFANMDDDGISEYLAQNKLPENYRAQVKGRAVSHRQWMGANERRARIQYRCKEFFNDYDVLLMPVTPNVAPLHDNQTLIDARRITINSEDRSYVDQFPWIGLATMAGLPATSAPIGRTQAGMPVGMQIVGPYLEDYTTIEFARLLAEITDGFVAPALSSGQ
ncbi:MAG: amidase [Cellvibrionaceae bacterium]|jgi:amidase